MKGSLRKRLLNLNTSQKGTAWLYIYLNLQNQFAMQVCDYLTNSNNEIL